MEFISENVIEEVLKNLVVFILVVIYQSCLNQLSDPTGIHNIDSETLESVDEENWEVFNVDGSQNYTKALDVFFKAYKQEDLLAFVEDTLVHDEKEVDKNQIVTQVGKEIIFLTSKTLIDCLAK